MVLRFLISVFYAGMIRILSFSALLVFGVVQASGQVPAVMDAYGASHISSVDVLDCLNANRVEAGRYSRIRGEGAWETRMLNDYTVGWDTIFASRPAVDQERAKDDYNVRSIKSKSGSSAAESMQERIESAWRGTDIDCKQLRESVDSNLFKSKQHYINGGASGDIRPDAQALQIRYASKEQYRQISALIVPDMVAQGVSFKQSMSCGLNSSLHPVAEDKAIKLIRGRKPQVSAAPFWSDASMTLIKVKDASGGAEDTSGVNCRQVFAASLERNLDAIALILDGGSSESRGSEYD